MPCRSGVLQDKYQLNNNHDDNYTIAAPIKMLRDVISSIQLW